MVQLRPHLTEEQFLSSVQSQMERDYRLSYIEDEGVIKAVAGYRFMTNLSAGYHMYLDDFVTDEKSRSQGYGSKLFDSLIQTAKEHNCKKLRLHSGVQRFGAHRFYLHKGMNITSHYFDLSC